MCITTLSVLPSEQSKLSVLFQSFIKFLSILNKGTPLDIFLLVDSTDE